MPSGQNGGMTEEQTSRTSDIAALDTQIAEQQAQINELRQQLGGQDGPQDPEDTAASLTNIEELEGAVDAMQQRRERLAGEG